LLKTFIFDRTGGPLEKAVIWAFLLGGFYFVWTNILRPAFQNSAETQADILNKTGEE
jgi:hypothetical protein